MTDPSLQQQQAQAEQDQTVALQDKLKGDTASIMSRYGAMVALTGATGGGSSSGSPLMGAFGGGSGADFGPLSGTIGRGLGKG